jgi:hypothetical protein
MERDVEGFVEVWVILEVAPSRRPRYEDEVAGRGDRQELGRSLHHPEHEGLPIGELSRRLPHPQGSQDNRQAESTAGEQDRNPQAAHAREYRESVSVGACDTVAATASSLAASVRSNPFHTRVHKLEELLWKC